MCRPIPSGVKHAERSWNIPEHSSKASSEASTGIGHAEHSWNIPEHSSKASEDSGMRNVPSTFRNIPRKLPGTFRNIPRTYGIGRTHPVLHLCSLSFRTDAIPSFFFFFFPLLYLLFSFLFFLRNRPYQADSTTYRPICEVKLPRARVVLRWGTTWEVRVLILLRVFNARFIIINLVLPFFSFFFYFLNFHFVYLFIFSFLIIAHDSCFWLVRNADKIQEWQCKICCHPGNWSARVFCRNVARR